MNKKKLFVIGAIVLGLGIGTIVGLQQVEDTEISVAQQEKVLLNVESRIIITSENVKKLDDATFYSIVPKNKEEGEILTQERLRRDAVIQEVVDKKYGRTEIERMQAIKNIKSFFGENIEVKYKQVVSGDYGADVLEIYEDDLGYKYRVDRDTNKVFEKIPGVEFEEYHKHLKDERGFWKKSPYITMNEAELIARAFVNAKVGNPDELEIQYGFQKIISKDAYLFEWGKVSPETGEFNDLQIVIIPVNGEISQYRNTLH